MADPFAKVAPGQRLRGNVRADSWNAMLACAAAFQGGALGGSDPKGSGRPPAPSLEVLVRNDTGEDLDAGAVVRVGASLVDFEAYPFDARGRPAFASAAVSSATDAFAVLSEPVKDEGIGRAVVLGIAVCDVLVDEDHDGDFASPTPGQSYLTAGASGPVRVLERAAGEGPQPAVVLIGGQGGGGEVNTVPFPVKFAADPSSPCVYIPVEWNYISGPGLTVSTTPPE